MKNVHIRSFSGPYFSACGPEKCGPEKLRIRTLFTQCHQEFLKIKNFVINTSTNSFIVRKVVWMKKDVPRHFQIVIIKRSIKMKVYFWFRDNMKLMNYNVNLKEKHFRIVVSRYTLRKKCPYSELFSITPNTDTFCAVILFRFQWQIEKELLKLRFRPGLSSISPLNTIKKAVKPCC